MGGNGDENGCDEARDDAVGDSEAEGGKMGDIRRLDNRKSSWQ